MPEKFYRFIINPASGKWKQTKKIVTQIEKCFDKSKDINFEIIFTEKPGHAVILAAEAAKKDFDAAISVGGDGTLNEVAASLVNTNTALGVIPRGSGNGFARSLKIPLKVKDSLEHLVNPKEKIVDVGVINKKFFFVFE
jgi:diacylglycerol kinase (ATP)